VNFKILNNISTAKCIANIYSAKVYMQDVQ